jgi:hypothetical protein
MNPIINMMNMHNPMLSMLQPIYNAMRGTQNPMAVIGQMASGDERMQQVMNTIQQNGGLQQAVYAEARNRNLNPDDALSQARQILQTFNMK